MITQERWFLPSLVFSVSIDYYSITVYVYPPIRSLELAPPLNNTPPTSNKPPWSNWSTDFPLRTIFVPICTYIQTYCAYTYLYLPTYCGLISMCTMYVLSHDTRNVHTSTYLYTTYVHILPNTLNAWHKWPFSTF